MAALTAAAVAAPQVIGRSEHHAAAFQIKVAVL
jgi:hypothetical protein